MKFWIGKYCMNFLLGNGTPGLGGSKLMLKMNDSLRCIDFSFVMVHCLGL